MKTEIAAMTRTKEEGEDGAGKFGETFKVNRFNNSINRNKLGMPALIFTIII